MAGGLPGLRGGDHVGLTVPHMEEAIDFFTKVLGCEFIYHGGEIGGDPEYMRERLGVHPEARCEYCFLRCGHGLNLELFEYAAPDQKPEPPKNSDIGGHHLAFYVDDIDAAAAYLRDNGVRVMGEPEYIDKGPSAGASWVYFLAPWGRQLELCCYPDGKAYAKNAPRQLWDPRHPQR